MTLWKWSQTAASNNSADSTINWSEGQAPSSVNDSARGMMAAVAKYRDDLGGSILTTGSSTAYAVTTNQGLTALTDKFMVAFNPHTTNGEIVTLAVDGLTAKPLRIAPSTEMPAGIMVQGTPYVATYVAATTEWILHGVFNEPLAVPIAGGFDFWGTTSPSSDLALPYGQAISRTTYATCFARMGTAFGTGDGSTTFNLPDCRGRVVAKKDNMGGSTASRLTSAGSGITGTTLGAAGGGQTVTLAQSDLPNVAPATGGSATFTGSASTWGLSSSVITAAAATANVSAGSGISAITALTASNVTTASITPSGSIASVATGSINGGVSQTTPSITQPTIVANYLIRIL